MSFIQDLLSDPTIPMTVKRSALQRIRSDPKIPITPASTAPSQVPFWLSDPHPSFSSSAGIALPADVDQIIIGSGITGTSVARHLLRSQQSSFASSDPESGLPPQILMLDARAISSGATGRNGGHINEVGFAEYGDLKEKYGKEAAVKITKMRLRHLSNFERVAQEEGLVEISQYRRVESFSVFYDDEAWQSAKRILAVFKEDLGADAHEWRAVEGPEAAKQFDLAPLSGIIGSPAGAIWPYKLVTGILSNLVRDCPNFHIRCDTPVAAIHKTTDGRFRVSTPAGGIITDHIIHCTNAHIGHLLPNFRERIFPVRGQMSAQTPAKAFTHQGMVRSWSLNYTVGFDYLTQLPKNYPFKNAIAAGGEMMFGGGIAHSQYRGIAEVGVSCDQGLSAEISLHLSTQLDQSFRTQGWQKEDAFCVKSMWTGIMGFSVDMLPWVGKLPSSLTGRKSINGKLISETEENKSAEWIAAGFSGEGMVNAWLCGEALATMILSNDNTAPEWFPEQIGISGKRLNYSLLSKLVDMRALEGRGSKL